MRSIFPKAGWMLAGVLALYVLSALAGAVTGGPLDPPGAPGPTMKTLGDIAPSWHQKLLANNGDGSGCESERFSCVMGGTAVLDNETGLVWQRTASAIAVNWETAELSCVNLATDGRTGWRLPTVSELRSLTEPGVINPSLPVGHPFVVSVNTIWTATQSSVSPGETLTVALSTGAVISRRRGDFSTTTPWCVRAPGGVEAGGAAIEPAPPSWSQILSAAGGVNPCETARFRCVLNSEAVLDRETGLVWQRTPDTELRLWSQAMGACERRFIGGRLGWRLASAQELLSLSDTQAVSLPAGHPFVGATSPTDEYWTSTTSYAADNSHAARVVDFDPGGLIATIKETDSLRAWCVRGGSGYDGGVISPHP